MESLKDVVTHITHSHLATFIAGGRLDKKNCLIFAAYGDSLRQVLGNRALMPLPVNQVKAIAYQVASGVQFLHTHKLIHTNIKPENIVLVDGSTSEITTFGNQTFRQRVLLRSPIVRLVDYEHSEFTGVLRSYEVGTCEYRAPEVTLGLPWSQPIDIFSLGCVIYELYTGSRLLHATKDILERLATIERAIGPFSETHVHELRKQGVSLFGRDIPPRVSFPAAHHASEGAIPRVARTVSFTVSLGRLCHSGVGFNRARGEQTYIKSKSLRHLLSRCLNPNSEERAVASSVVKHPYICSATHL
ncbi:kinase-like domain-containing protein [Ephemerocybe angulata]|uniref:Kinase-like domain-containing protein n=1 Tax=Ephemerocybe angulata TaxID=980116 RepID=A0A8H6HEU5_9AGAR|nr:kinase-like domain-containing protein [Tulosesus angulatus]